VIVDSESTKRDVVRLYRKQAESINVVHLAADPCYRPIDDECSRTRVRERYGLPDRFLLYVGTIEPRKNLVRLIEAYKRVRRDIGNAPLVLAGGLGWKYEGILKAAADPELDESVLMPGRIPDEDLPVLYSLASAFVFPSLYEGFGLPPLEALQSGCPVVTSNSSSLPEVVGDAGIQVDPRSTEEICEALIRIMSSEDLRQDLRERGLTRARRFSWARCAAETIAVYQRAAGAFTTDVTAV
jgi:glycosyltransferase involved in cell wall biosynthesis